ncbi:aspartate aminotransferase family protein [Fervidibacillus halotolerans]|uniref:Aspartate aminotransferase family protein n=1 Tax=Fervidibacillus halotolerans TaxID=2980027 RepID=A0A9E8M0J0_9BACI|nr:aspartate aminotransferase family protein [Fervidibacillus halotolerans]WAA12951.1 aspartate aminotransferase family protein [Fervidibacillus halotolerans]
MAVDQISFDFYEFLHRTEKSREWLKKAVEVMPGGVTANIKSFAPYPIIMKHGHGAYLEDVDGNEYIDYLLAYGALMIGHNHPKMKERIVKQLEEDGTNLFGTPHEREYRLAKRIQSYYPSMEMVRYTNSGTEGTLLAIRLANAYTGKQKIAKFEGHYHGGYDKVLFSINPDPKKAGPIHTPTPIPESKGIDPYYEKNILILPFNDLKGTEAILNEHKDEIAAVIIEPIQGGFIPATPAFIQGLRKITEQLGIILIFDEVKTGFRIGIGGAQSMYGVKPDLTVLGKVIGGGFPIGIVGGKKEIMMESGPKHSSDVFDVSQGKKTTATEVLFHSGTYNGHPTILAVADTVLDILEEEGKEVLKRTERLKKGLEDLFRKRGIPMQALGKGTIFSVVLTEKDVKNYRDLQNSNLSLRKKIDYLLLNEGIYTKPMNRYSLSVAHGDREIERTLDAYQNVLYKKL